MDTTNEQMVAVQGDSIVILRPIHRMTKEQAIRHAAWLVALSDYKNNTFPEVLAAVQNGSAKIFEFGA